MHGVSFTFNQDLSNKEIFLLENSEIIDTHVELLSSLIGSTRDTGIFLDLGLLEIDKFLYFVEDYCFYIPAEDVREVLSAEYSIHLEGRVSFLIDQAPILSASHQWAIFNCCPQKHILFAGNHEALQGLEKASDWLDPVEDFLEELDNLDLKFIRDIDNDSSWLQRLMTYTYGYEESFSRMKKAGLLIE